MQAVGEVRAEGERAPATPGGAAAPPTPPELVTWLHSGERARAKSRRRVLCGVGAFLVIVGFTTLGYSYDEAGDVERPAVAVAAGVLALIGLSAGVGGLYQFQDAHADYLQAAQRERVNAAIEQLQNSMELADLFRLNQRQIDAYHDLTKAQAAHSYRNSQLAMGIGFLVLLAGSIVAITTRDDTAKVVVGALASLGAAISGYVGATFMRAHNESLAQLNFYFRQPLVNSYLLTAERLAAKVQDSAEVYQRTCCLMIEHVMSNAFLAPQGRAHDGKSPPIEATPVPAPAEGQPA